jgi:hypothetical protein
MGEWEPDGCRWRNSERKAWLKETWETSTWFIPVSEELLRLRKKNGNKEVIFE